jgi:alpha-tubulin suppressor-like RCC1 family protein
MHRKKDTVTTLLNKKNTIQLSHLAQLKLNKLRCFVFLILGTSSLNLHSQVLATGKKHSSFVCSDNENWTFGRNNMGQLGNNTTTDSNFPLMTGISNSSKVACGVTHSILLKTDGTVWAWGRNNKGQLGDGTTTDRLSPTQVTGLTGIVYIAAGDEFSIAVKNDGTVWTWGRNHKGQLGDNTTTDRNSPVQVVGGASTCGAFLCNITKIAAGSTFSLAIMNDGSLWSWGQNDKGQLGNGTTIDQIAPVKVLTGASGCAINLCNIIEIAAGEKHSIALKSDGTVWTFGRNDKGQLGDNTTTDRSTPVQVVGGTSGCGAFICGISKLGSGAKFTTLLKSDGLVYSFGHNNMGQLGDCSTTDRFTPVQVNGVTNIVALSKGCSNVFSLSLDNNGDFLVWGQNDKGQLGDNSNTDRICPVRIGALCIFVPLSIELSAFEIACLTDETVLNWTVSSQKDNDFFTIERSLDGYNFEEIGWVEGHGTQTESKSYEFTDNNIYPEKIYYRLKQTDYDGKESVHPIKSTFCANEDDIVIYPNPSQGIIHISGIKNNLQGALFDSVGRLLLQFELTNNSIDLNHLPNGVYSLQISNNLQLITKKITLSK